MSRESEKIVKTADEYLELAEEATTKAAAEKYIKKALELEPDNLDAVSASLDLIDDSTVEYYQKLSEAIKNGTKQQAPSSVHLYKSFMARR